jgi:hypothetical protein
MLTHQHRRLSARVAGIPLIGEHEELDADEVQP